MLIANVGDSRAYVYMSDELHIITEDQTWVNEVGRRLGIGEEQLKVHPMRHMLTMAIGVSQTLRIHSYAVPLEDRRAVSALLRRSARRGRTSRSSVRFLPPASH